MWKSSWLISQSKHMEYVKRDHNVNMEQKREMTG